MAAASPQVEAFLLALEHPKKAEIERLREIVRSSHPEIQERIKWKAPSFGLGEDDRITFHIQSKVSVQIVFHRGAKVKDASDFEFKDPSGLMEWKAKDRSIVKFRSLEEVEEKAETLASLSSRWLEETK